MSVYELPILMRCTLSSPSSQLREFEINIRSAEAMMQDYIFHFYPSPPINKEWGPKKILIWRWDACASILTSSKWDPCVIFINLRVSFAFIVGFGGNWQSLWRTYPKLFATYICQLLSFGCARHIQTDSISFCFGRKRSNILCKHHKNYICCPQ